MPDPTPQDLADALQAALPDDAAVTDPREIDVGTGTALAADYALPDGRAGTHMADRALLAQVNDQQAAVTAGAQALADALAATAPDPPERRDPVPAPDVPGLR
jgi:hypothetical protein